VIAGATPSARRYAPLIGPTIAFAIYLLVASVPGLWEAALRAVYPAESRVLFEHISMLRMVGQTLVMVGISSALSVLIGVGLGIFVTRPYGADFLDVVNDFANLGQTFPPIAVFTLAVPYLGFGLRPTILALTLYGILPVLLNTIAGLRGLPDRVIESAQGMGLSPSQVLRRVELPLAAPVILAGVRISVVINVSTSVIGAFAGAGGLGAPIVSGLVNQDPAVVLEGAILTAALALILDAYVGAVERIVASRPGTVREKVASDVAATA
jgi:osmoprotectant transport system permease protein